MESLNSSEVCRRLCTSCYLYVTLMAISVRDAPERRLWH